MRHLPYRQHVSLRRFAVSLAAAVIGLFTAETASARLTVGPGGGSCQYATIQAAIDAAGTVDTISVSSGGTYNERLTITDKSLTISSCPCNLGVCLADGINNTLTSATISGSGGATAPVLKIVTTNPNNPVTVNLDRLIIQDGHSGGTDGGGISFSGTGSLALTRTTLTSNTADYGAGINFKANGGNATLTINHDTFITHNTAAQSGGGIRIEGTGALLNMNAANTWVAFNEATAALGGGMEVINGAHVNIGSPGYLFGGVIYENTAKRGGGIAFSGGTIIYMYTTDPLHPVTVDSNTAYNTGGGLYGVDGYMCMQNLRLTNNIAQEGTAIYSDVDGDGFGAGFYINDASNCAGFATLNGVACDPSQPCNIVHDNVAKAVQNGNQTTDGATILIQSGGVFRGNRIDVRGNTGGYAFRALGNTITPALYTDVGLSNCLFTGNPVNHELLLTADGNAHTSVRNCTLAHNLIGGAQVISADDTLALDYNIIDEGDVPALAFSGADSSLDNLYNIAGNTSGMATTPYNIQTTATFVDANGGDYRLFYGLKNGVLVKSFGIDYGPPVPSDNLDIRGLPRDQSVASPLFGVRDLGAYEMQGVGDRIFIDTFGDPQLLVQ